MSRLNKVFTPIRGLSLSIGIITSCVSIKPVYFDDDKELARERVEEFHKQYNGRDFEEISKSFTQGQREMLTDVKIAETLERNLPCISINRKILPHRCGKPRNWLTNPQNTHFK
ncbi:MAG: hypothetical protein OEM82_15470 [Acidobacteriota bacterium]|nr:hypothetical protein [Acidobacteriota bacterium]